MTCPLAGSVGLGDASRTTTSRPSRAAWSTERCCDAGYAVWVMGCSLSGLVSWWRRSKVRTKSEFSCIQPRCAASSPAASRCSSVCAQAQPGGRPVRGIEQAGIAYLRAADEGRQWDVFKSLANCPSRCRVLIVGAKMCCAIILVAITSTMAYYNTTNR